MPNWLKQFTTILLVVLVIFFGFIRYQSWQYLAAYIGYGFATKLPVISGSPKPVNCTTEPLQVMSFNVMYGSSTIESMAKRFRGGSIGGGYLPWSVRAPEIRERIISYAPDLLGLQEMETDADVGAIVPLDNYTLVTYHLGLLQYGDAALLFKTSKFDKLNSGQVWLGPLPDLPMSLGFNRLSMVRYVNWVMLREKSTGFEFMFINTHFDNSIKNKEPSATLFYERIARLAKGLPIILSGDFNTKANTERYRRFTGNNERPALLRNAYEYIDDTATPVSLRPDKLIDHILMGGPCRVGVDQWLVDTRPLKNGTPMSDHNLVFAKLHFTS